MSRKMGLTALHTSVLVAVLGCSHTGFAQEATLSPSSSQGAPLARVAPLTLDIALKSAPLDSGEFALAIGADLRPLPEDARQPGPLTSISAVASDFGQVAHRFGPVLAVAPPTMTVLNTNLHSPRIYDGMPVSDAVKLLAATLTPVQWNAFTSPQGLAFADLTGPDQQSLFRASLGTQTLRAYPSGGGDSQPIDATADLPQARLRLGSHTDIELPTSDRSWRGGAASREPAGLPRYTLDLSDHPNGATLYGNIVKTEVTNKLKPGNLDFDAPALHVPVPLAGLKTVNDLVSRVGTLTKKELYADPHYASRSVTVVAGSSGATGVAAPMPMAGDLLRALAYCLTATYRQVGPAYVLTDDLAGVGVRRLLFADQEALANQLRRGPLESAGDIISAQHGVADLRPFEGGADQRPTPDEVKKDQSTGYSMDTPGMYVHLPFADLTPAQQATARASAAEAASTQANQPLQGGEQHLPSLDGTLLLVTQPTLELLVPSVPGPINLDSYDMQELFRPSQKTMDAQMEAHRKMDQSSHPAGSPKSAKAPAPPAPRWRRSFRAFRAALPWWTPTHLRTWTRRLWR